MTWLSAVPAAMVAILVVVLPGLLVARAAGWRGVTPWGLAPLLSVGLIGGTAIVAQRLSVAWSLLPVAVSTIGSALVVAVVRLAVARRRPGDVTYRGVRAAITHAGPVRRVRALAVRLATPAGRFARTPEPVTRALPTAWPSAAGREGRDGGWAGPAAFLGTAAAAVLGWLTVVRGFGPVDAISSTYDAVFHYNAVAHIIATGDGSSLTLGNLSAPGRSDVAYPAAWHDLVALVAMVSGTTIPVATNVTAYAVAAVAWPLSCLMLVRQTIGRSPAAFLLAPVLATAFTALPWLLMSFGVLWPNLLGLALVPAGLAAVVTLVGLARRPVLGRVGALVLLVLSVPALGLAHPNAVISLAVLGLCPMLWAALGTAVRIRRVVDVWKPLSALAGAAAVIAGTVWFLAASPFLAGVRKFDWPAFTTTGGAVEDMLLNAPSGRPALWVASVLVLVGAVSSLRRASTGWLVPAHALSGFLYVLAASQENELTTALTGAWYNDSYRLAAMVPISGVPLATIAVLGVSAATVRLVSRLTGRRHPRLRRRRAVIPVAAVAVTALAVLSNGLEIGTHADVLAGPYQQPASPILVPGQREFLEDAGTLLPPGAVVAANPFTGNALLYALSGRDVLYPHVGGNWDPDRMVVAQRLRDVATDPEVCSAVTATRTTYAIDGPVHFWPWDGRASSYPGITQLAEAPGFEPITSGGGYELFRITACAAPVDGQP